MNERTQRPSRLGIALSPLTFLTPIASLSPLALLIASVLAATPAHAEQTQALDLTLKALTPLPVIASTALIAQPASSPAANANNLTATPAQPIAPSAAAASDATSLSFPPKATRRYLDAGGLYLTLGGGVAYDFSSATDINGFAQISTFVAPRLEIGGELGGWYFDQRGQDTGGVSGSLAIKYHFIPSDLAIGEPDDRTLTFFPEIGLGVLGAFDEVPDGGTHWNFLPRAGGGVTYAINEDARLVAGLRWHHISNARISSNSSNPARDGLMFYVGLTFELP